MNVQTLGLWHPENEYLLTVYALDALLIRRLTFGGRQGQSAVLIQPCLLEFCALGILLASP